MKNYKLLSFLCFLTLIISCSQKTKQSIIRGNISNLPDGILYIIKDNSAEKIDSVKTVNGTFNLIIKWKEGQEYSYIGLDHFDKKGILRGFSFPTNANYKNGKWNSQFFMNDSLILINGKIKEFNLKNLQISEKFKIVVSPKIIAGKQTEAFYNIDGDLFEKIDYKTIKTISEKLKKYPYSYHLLYKISENKNSFTAQQVSEYLKLFKGEITESESYKKLYAYNQKRLTEKSISLPKLDNAKGIKTEILNKNYKKHLFVFWASWCGPCRAEIPLLKKLYAKEKDNIEFISISIDDDKNAWLKALSTENIAWKQFVVNKNDKSYEILQIQLKLNSAIPYTVLVDNNLKILSTSMGLSTEEELIKLINTK